MDATKAKYFIYEDPITEIIYKSKDLDKILEQSKGRFASVYAVIETESGDTLMHMDRSYAGEPIIMGRFIHAKFYFDAKCYHKIIDL